jgi:hypothetical protein
VWRFGLAPDCVGNWLRAYGWRLVEDVGYGELGRSYVAPTGQKRRAGGAIVRGLRPDVTASQACLPQSLLSTHQRGAAPRQRILSFTVKLGLRQGA